MRNLIYTAFTSIDGVVEGPGPEDGYPNSGWTFEGRIRLRYLEQGTSGFFVTQ